jgi:DNA repair protein RecN (Recombination protein N)
MLSQLTIQNFGLIDRLSIDFADHLNILTGETGAGKSIIIDALRYVLGERLESSLIRDPKQTCLVQAAFELTNKELRDHLLFADYLQDGESQLIIERAYQPDGRSKIKINGLILTLAQLKETGNHLIDFHGAHDHQMLLQESQHIVMLDKLAKADDIKKDYTGSFAIYRELSSDLQALTDLSKTNQRDFDLLQHQLKELETVPLEDTDYEKLEQEQLKINNAEKLNSCIEQILGIFEDEDAGVDGMIGKAFSPLRTLNQVDETTTEFTDLLTTAQENIQDFLNRLRSYADSLSFDGQAAQNINDRYDSYQDIKRKYGPTLAEAKEFYIQAKEKFELLSNLEHNDAELRQKIEAQKKELAKIAQKITKKRQAAALELKSTIEKELKELGINHVEFEVRMSKAEFHKDGQDQVVFFISPNAGVELKPLAEIVSSGEAARVMLALKKALINVDTIPVLIFDEIDAQIGGRLGTVTGKKLKELARDRQVILITHLPQIASFADVHFKIFKSVKNGRAMTQISQLDEDGRVKEIAEMMTGQSKTEISISHAEDMLTTARKTKISSSKV